MGMLSPFFRLNKATNQARTATVFHGTTQVALYTAPAAMDDPRGASKWCLKIGYPQTIIGWDIPHFQTYLFWDIPSANIPYHHFP